MKEIIIAVALRESIFLRHRCYFLDKIPVMKTQYLNRDVSWISFNGRVLMEAQKIKVPLVERIKFLSIFSSNLDEFYRVRMPAIMLLRDDKSQTIDGYTLMLEESARMIQWQQEQFGKILTGQLIPALKENGIHLLYDSLIPEEIEYNLKEYFQSEVMAFLQLAFLSAKENFFFAKSNALYQVVVAEDERGGEEIILLNIPSNNISRFYSVVSNGTQYIIFLEDIIKKYLPLLFPGKIVKGAYNIKITRDAELDLADELEGNLEEKIARQLIKRDDGYATRFLYGPGISPVQLNWLIVVLRLTKANAVEGGYYHNLKDLGAIPVKRNDLSYPTQPPIVSGFAKDGSIFEAMLTKDHLLHTPYQSYSTVLRFFNEAAVDIKVAAIFVTLYRVAGDSKIVNALITAANNGKKVTVFIELKARFDEENNIRWSKRMKAAGIDIIDSIPGLKVHAKVALVKRNDEKGVQYFGLLATGNLNEITARFYTDHILLTSHREIVTELEQLFIFLTSRRKPEHKGEILFQHLLVAQFNLHHCFLTLIDEEIKNAREGKPAGIVIKMNNLEERVLINKLYEASQAGVKVEMIVRSICCLAAGVAGMSEQITVSRIVDRYLEHGRVFIFKNGGEEKIFMGSADWMNRNVYRRIEVCFPIYDPLLKAEMLHIIKLQLKDNVQAVSITAALDNEPVRNKETLVRSQTGIYHFLRERATLVT